MKFFFGTLRGKKAFFDPKNPILDRLKKILTKRPIFNSASPEINEIPVMGM